MRRRRGEEAAAAWRWAQRRKKKLHTYGMLARHRRCNSRGWARGSSACIWSTCGLTWLRGDPDSSASFSACGGRFTTGNSEERLRASLMHLLEARDALLGHDAVQRARRRTLSRDAPFEHLLGHKRERRPRRVVCLGHRGSVGRRVERDGQQTKHDAALFPKVVDDRLNQLVCGRLGHSVRDHSARAAQGSSRSSQNLFPIRAMAQQTQITVHQQSPGSQSLGGHASSLQRAQQVKGQHAVHRGDEIVGRLDANAASRPASRRAKDNFKLFCSSLSAQVTFPHVAIPQPTCLVPARSR